MITTKNVTFIGLALIGLVGCATTGTTGTTGRTDPGVDTMWALADTPLDRTAARLDNSTTEHLIWVDTLRDQIVRVDAPRTIENTLAPFSDMRMHLDAAAAESSLFFRVHPDESVRDAAQRGEQAVSKRVTELSLDRELYDAITAVDVHRADAATRFFVAKTIRDFRRKGVDKDAATRAKVEALDAEIVALGQQFAKNIVEDTREVVFDSPADLDGLPQDWIDKHKPADDGKIHVTTDYPDYIPFLTYAHSGDARLALYKKFKDRGYPKNIEVLRGLLEKRHELAQLLGYRNYAEYITEDKMIGSAGNAHAFIEKIVAASREAADRDYLVLLARKKTDDPSATEVGDWEKGYYEELVKAEDYAFDSQAVRPYFDFATVRQGLFDLTGKMFGVKYRQVHGLDLWHDEVTAWDVVEGNKLLGRFYLDLHPRPNKYKHAAQFDYRTGIAGKRLPQAVLVCNFPNPADSEDGVALMEHGEVVTFFHEFGHLLHAIFAGHRKWMGNAGITTEWDFVEAPSQMLEEFCWDVETLQLFAKHYQTGEPIPEGLVTRMKRAGDFGKGMATAHQMFYASVSLQYYDADPSTLDTTKKLIALQKQYSPFNYVEDTHFQCNFGHLDGYSAIYYTYMWSKVIAKDMFSRFTKEGLLNTRTSRDYRRKVLDPGGSKEAAHLVSDFLGRPYSFDAFEEWLNRS